MGSQPTYAVGTGMLAIAFGPELIALIASSADPPADGTGGARGPCWTVGMLPVLLLRPGARKMRVVDAYVLLELLQGVVGALGEGVEASRVEVGRLDMAVGEESRGGDRMVGREPVERVGQHLDGSASAGRWMLGAVDTKGEDEVEFKRVESEWRCISRRGRGSSRPLY